MEEGLKFPSQTPEECTALGRPAVEKEATSYMVWNLRSWTVLVRLVMEERVAASFAWLPRACPVLGRQAAEDGAQLPWLGRP